jgi:hypothetical protein
MKFLKQQNINRFNPRDQRLFTNQFGLGVMNLNGGLRLPQGTEAQRPDPTKGRWPGIATTQTLDEYADGTIRYNIDTNSLECLIAGIWEVVRGPGATAITKQTPGPGDGFETVFPLLSVPVGTSYQADDPATNNIIVLIGPAWQISGTNFNVYQSVGGSLSGPSAPYADGWYIKFTSPVPAATAITIYYGFSN